MAEDSGYERFGLVGRVAVVTGGTEGIGRGVARLLAKAGARVVVASRREEAVATTERQLREAGAEALGVSADVTSEEDVGRLFDETERVFGGVDVLVNCAGGSTSNRFRRALLVDLTTTDLVESYRLNVVAAFLCSTTAVPTMRRRGGGVIVNISSMATERFGGLLSVYGANKAALEHLTRSMAGQFAPAIRVNAISPGPIESAKMKGARPNWPAERQEALVQAIALGRLGTSEDVAHGVLFLVSPLASWITGVVLPIHGGKGLVSDLPS